MRGVIGSSGLEQQVGTAPCRSRKRAAQRGKGQCVWAPLRVVFTHLRQEIQTKPQLRSGSRGFKAMAPEIALNRWLTCGCIVSATRKITARCRFRCPRCRSLPMSGFPVFFTPPLVWSCRVSLCALGLSIPASRYRGPCCALWRCRCPPPPPPSVRPPSSPLLWSYTLKLPQTHFMVSRSEKP